MCQRADSRDFARLSLTSLAVWGRNVHGRFLLRLGLHASHLISLLECDFAEHFGKMFG